MSGMNVASTVCHGFKRPDHGRPHGDDAATIAVSEVDHLGRRLAHDVLLLRGRMPGVQLIIHVGRKSGVEHHIGDLDAATFEVEKQPPGEGAARRRHLYRPRLSRVYSLVVVQVPGFSYVAVADGASNAIDCIHQFGASLGEANPPEPRNLRVSVRHSSGESRPEVQLDAAAQIARQELGVLTQQKGEPGVIGEMLSQTHLDAGFRRSLATYQRGWQCSACIEDKQIARTEIISQVVEPGVLDLACSAVDNHQPDFVARDSPAFRGLTRRQFRRQDK